VKPRASRRGIAEMAFVVRGLLDDLATFGGVRARAHREAVELVDAYTRGETPSREAIASARAAIAKVTGRVGIGGPPMFVALSYVPIELLFRMIEDGDDLSKYVLQHAARAVVGDPPGGAAKRVEELHARAVTSATDIDDTPIPTPPHEIVVEGTAKDLDLPVIAIAHLTSCAAARTGRHAHAEATRALLVERGYDASPELLAFEAAYGGLELFETDPDAAALVVGPYAFIAASPRYSSRDGDLVPVAIAWNDVYYALDPKGRGFTNAAMVEGVYRPSAESGRSLLTQAILWRALETHPCSFATHDGAHGAALARERGLAAIADATGETERWWGDADGMRLVVEIDRGNGYTKPMTYATELP
jgi:hypothetical protein